MRGGGLPASVDGLRFVVPVKSVNTGPSPKYYGYKHGVTWLNAVNDQVAGIGAMVVRGTPRDLKRIATHWPGPRLRPAVHVWTAVVTFRDAQRAQSPPPDRGVH